MSIPSLEQYYAEVLKANGFVPPADEIEKFAAAQKIDVEVAKIARGIFEQLQLDGVQYENAAAMFDDSIKIASGYLDLVKQKTEEAEKLAGDLHRAALVAMESFLAHNRIELDANEAVKIAGLQAASFQELTRREAQSRQLESVEASKVATEGGAAKAAPSVSHPYLEVPVTQNQSAANLNMNALGDALATHYGRPEQAVGIKTLLDNHLAANVPKEQHAEFGHVLWQNAKHLGPGVGVEDLINATHSGTGPAQRAQAAAAAPAAGAAANSGKLFGMRPGVALGAGALGAGALYLLHKKREAARQQQQASLNRQGALVHGAGMPEAV